MDACARNELCSIKAELNSIISELESICAGVGSEFFGIGSDQCAQSLAVVLTKYYEARRRLRNLDTTTVTESYAAAHSGGSSR